MCQACASDTFTTSPNSTSCQLWTTCERGSYIATQGSPSSDRVCSLCDEGETSTTTNSTTCIPLPKQIAVGDNFACGLTNDGHVRCWGDNGGGQLGVSTNITGSTTPLEVPNISSVTQICAGPLYACALHADKTVTCWGRDYQSLSYGPHPMAKVPGLSSVVDIACGFEHNCAALEDGTVWCWGGGRLNRLGNGSDDDSFTPVHAVGVTNAVEVAAGYTHSCARLRDGTVTCWGSQCRAELGVFTPGSSCESSPVVVPGLPGPVTSINAGDSFTCAVSAQGSLVCWGANDNGQLGYPSSSPFFMDSPTPIPNVTDVRSASGHGYAGCAVSNGGSLRCWGQVIGDGTRDPDQPPTKILDDARQISVGTYVRCALTRNHLKCWGRNGAGQLANPGAGDFSAVPVLANWQ